MVCPPFSYDPHVSLGTHDRFLVLAYSSSDESLCMHRHASQQLKPRESPFSAVSFTHPQLDPVAPQDGTSSRLSSEFVKSHQKQVTSDVLSKKITKRFACT